MKITIDKKWTGLTTTLKFDTENVSKSSIIKLLEDLATSGANIEIRKEDK